MYLKDIPNGSKFTVEGWNYNGKPVLFRLTRDGSINYAITEHVIGTVAKRDHLAKAACDTFVNGAKLYCREAAVGFSVSPYLSGTQSYGSNMSYVKASIPMANFLNLSGNSSYQFSYIYGAKLNFPNDNARKATNINGVAASYMLGDCLTSNTQKTYIVNTQGQIEEGGYNTSSYGFRPVVNFNEYLRVEPLEDGTYHVPELYELSIADISDGVLSLGDNGLVKLRYSGIKSLYVYFDGNKYSSSTASGWYDGTNDAIKSRKLGPGKHLVRYEGTRIDGKTEALEFSVFVLGDEAQVCLKDAILHSTRPKKGCVLLVGKLGKADYEVYVTNNGFDESPTWQDVTGSVKSGKVFTITNTSKTSGSWGYNVKVKITRNGEPDFGLKLVKSSFA